MKEYDLNLSPDQVVAVFDILSSEVARIDGLGDKDSTRREVLYSIAAKLPGFMQFFEALVAAHRKTDDRMRRAVLFHVSFDSRYS